jgi:beta-1,4-N-acetylglucosaminyltransferase
MLSMIRSLDPERYANRTYIVSSGDHFSAAKAAEFEAQLERRTAQQTADLGDGAVLSKQAFRIVTVPRARRIHQPLYTVPVTCVQSLYACVRALLPDASAAAPDVIVTNGPATGVMVVFAALIIQFLGLGGFGEDAADMKTIYVESWARVKTLSLSGSILQWGLVDRFLVQWEGLKGGRREYRGVMVD